MTMWPTRKGVSVDDVRCCISPWLGRTRMRPSCDERTLSWTRMRGGRGMEAGSVSRERTTHL